jgi:hypothetical protein
MTIETRKRLNYTGFKWNAVALVTEQGYEPPEASRSQGIGAMWWSTNSRHYIKTFRN